VSFIGYEVSKMELVDEQYIFYLAPNLELEEVNINSKQKSSKFSTIGTLNVETLNTEEFEKAACCNLSESFETNATVDVVYNDAVSGAKKIRMLGLDGIYTQNNTRESSSNKRSFILIRFNFYSRAFCRIYSNYQRRWFSNKRL
jgi:hypothetical protein